MLISSNNLLKNAKLKGYAFPHFNYWDSNSIRAEISAAEKLKLPIILAWAQSHSNELDIQEALVLGKYYGSKANVPVVLHLDHGADYDTVVWGIDHGFTSVMIDASDRTINENIQITQEIVAYAHQRGVVVEAEIGHVGTNNSADNTIYTEVDAAAEFVAKTNVDSLAVSIGTSHGVYKQGKPKLSFERLTELKEAVPVPLVLHGGSSSGDDNLKLAAQSGISKVNIYTDLSNAALEVINTVKCTTQIELLQKQREAIKKVAMHYYKVFETANYQYIV